MYGVKIRANGVEEIRWIDNDEKVVRLFASLAMQMTLNSLSKFEGDFDVIEETDNTYRARGTRTGFEVGMEIVKA